MKRKQRKLRLEKMTLRRLGETDVRKVGGMLPIGGTTVTQLAGGCIVTANGCHVTISCASCFWTCGYTPCGSATDGD